jgi:outer membrane receptor protein involved in Fe transport
MKPNPKISAAVAAILWAPSATIVFAAPADTAAATGTGGELQEVVVTAERRTENLQDVPITIQAISGDQLKQLNIVSFNDLLKYTPNVTFSGNGPGTGNIFMRGLGGTGSGNQSQSTTAPFPNVAQYLDDQSMQFPARNNDVYLVDMERVEILEGPQGTLFGGGAQAGAIRYITNKPKFDAVSGEANFGYGTTAHGDQNGVLNAVLNLPVTDSFALRGVIFSERRGGYIDNVPSTINYYPGQIPVTPKSNPTANNGAVAGSATNPVTYTGGRLSAAMKFNDSWDLLLQQNYQDMKADGYFYAYPATGYIGVPLAPYQITAFTPAYTKDKYESTAWTLNGKITDLLSMVYTGSYLTRNIDGQQDYSNYMRSTYGNSYACIGTGAGFFNPKHFPVLAGKPLQCSTPVGSWRDQVHNTHTSHELRFSTNADYRLRGLAGFYWEKFVINDNMNFNYLGVPECNQANLTLERNGGADCISAVGPLPGTYAGTPGLRTDANTAFGEDAQRGYKQRAGFVSVDFDLIPKVLTFTGGVRFYHYDEFEHGTEYLTETTNHLVVDTLNGVCTAAGGCGFPMSLDKAESGHRWRGNLTWHIAPDLMAYYTYSEGFRPGAFNRTHSLPNGQVFLAAEIPFCNSKLATCINQDQYEKPAGYESDNLINNEIGLKTEFLDHRLLVDLSAYYMKWNNIQLALFNPSYFGNTTFNVNGPNFEVKGFEVQFVARITDALTVQGSSSVNSSRQSNAPCLESVGVDPNNASTANNPTPKGTCITTINGTTVPDQLGAHDTPPAFSPPWMFNLRARYDWSVAGNARPFAWVGASHIGPMTNEPRNYFSGSDPKQSNPPTTTMLLYDIPGYTTYDAAIGVSKDNWTALISGSNLANEYGPTNVSSGQYIKSEIPLRPRVLMAQFSLKF